MSTQENKSPQFGSLTWMIVIGLVVLLVAIAIPNFVRPVVGDGAHPPCAAILRELDSAKQQWALEYGKTNGTVCTENDVKQFIKLDSNGNLPKCPQGGIYTIGKVSEPVTCSLGKTNPNHILP